MSVTITVTGACGRMGQALIQAISQEKNAQLAAVLERADSPMQGFDAASFMGKKSGILIGSNIQAALDASDVLIDFTRPESSMAYLKACVAARKNMVIGTTGFSEEEKAAIRRASESIGIVFAPNFSIGVNLVFSLLETATRVLSRGYDMEIIEAHHKHKVDAPSGTALRMGEVMAKTMGKTLDDVAVYAREGHTGERCDGSIGFSVIRGGDIVGDHTALYASDGERVEITHKASSRLTFASGAIRAALWLNGQSVGLYDMQDVLGLKKPCAK